MCYTLIMDISELESIGLSPQQAEVYAYLIKNGSTKPSLLAQHLRLSRTNAYKILDSMVDLKIIVRETKGKTLAYKPENPLSLASLTANYRAEAVSREEKVNKIMHDLLEAYSVHTKKPGVEVFTGRDEVIKAYRKQLGLGEDLKFIHTRADVPSMGFDVMHDIRVEPSQKGKRRHAIMSNPLNSTINYEQYLRSNLDVTWIENGKYSSPVEWSATDSSLLIISYSTTPQAVLIIDPIIALAFSQLWSLIESNLKTTEHHKELVAANKTATTIN